MTESVNNSLFALRTTYFAYGVALFGIGASWPARSDELSVDIATLGFALAAYGIARALSAELLARFTRLRSAVSPRIAAYAGAAALLSIAFMDKNTLLIGFMMLGMFIGCIDLNGSLAAFKRRGRSELLRINGAFGIGAIVGSAAVVAFTSVNVGPLRASTISYLLGGSLLALAAHGLSKSPDCHPTSDRRASLTALDLALLVAVAGAEFTIGQWASTFLVDKAKLGLTTSAFAVTAYWAGASASRFVLARIHTRDSITLFGGSAVLTVGAFLLISGIILPAIAVGICGLGVGPLYPLIIARRAESSGGARGVANSITMSTLGSAGFPLLVGLTWNSYPSMTLTVVASMPLTLLLTSRILPRRS